MEGLHLDAGVLGGLALGVGEVGGGEAAALAVAGEVGAQPVGQGVLGGGRGEAVGDEHEHAVGEVAEALGQTELMPQAAQGEEGAEAEGVEGDGVIGGGRFVAAAEFEDAVEVLGEEVLAAERDDGAAGGAAVFPDGFAEVDVLIGVAAGGGFDEHGEHRSCYLVQDSRKVQENKGENGQKPKIVVT